MKVVIGSDLVPTDNNIQMFKEGKIRENLENDFSKIWYQADYRVINLECVLGNKKELKPIYKSGPNIIVNSECIKGIKELKADLALLANNHILDYGVKGLNNTTDLLDKNKINYTGIIDNIYQNIKVSILEKDGIKVGIYNVCENEFSGATEDSKGANTFAEIKNYREIENNKKNVDKLIVIFHGGKEFYRYPSPNLQRIAHNFIDYGADLVIIQHSHCVGCKEEYKNKEILYGQGNLIFYGDDNEFWNTELLIELDIKKDNIEIKYYPLEKINNLVGISKNSKILSDFYDRSEKIKDYKFIESEYKKFALEYLNNYLFTMNQITFFKRIINKLHKIFHKKYFVKKYKMIDYLGILNIIECEAHRELLTTGIKEQIKKMEKENE